MVLYDYDSSIILSKRNNREIEEEENSEGLIWKVLGGIKHQK